MMYGTLRQYETQQRITTIIEQSFDTRPMPSGTITGREVKRRVDLARDIYLVLLNDCLWSEPRILDHLPAFIARALDGEEPIPDWAKKKEGDSGSRMWGVESAGKVESERRLTALSQTERSPLIVLPGKGHHGN